jgi:transcriptional regulator with XRE-family HTH domain
MNNQLDEEALKLLDLISNNVARLRKEKGFSQLQLATEMGYSSASYFGRMEVRKDGEHFNITQLYKISKILNIPITLFFESTE